MNEDLELNIEMNKTLFLILVLIYPLVDLLRVFIIRIYNKKSPFVPDHNHIHHIAVKHFNSHFKALMIINLSSLVILLIALIITK